MRRVLFEKFLVFLLTLRCEVVISWDLSGVLNAVVGPLGYNGEVDTVAKEILVWLTGGGASVGRKRGRTTPSQKKVFDSTKGFPGEDVAKQPQC